MASFRKALDRGLNQALCKMAGGSQEDPATVAGALLCLIKTLESDQYWSKPEGLQPCLRPLLQAAGWLYPCFMPSSRLTTALQSAVQDSWVKCMYLAYSISAGQKHHSMVAFQALLQPYRKPAVPGVLVWLSDMADQLTPAMVQRFHSAGASAASVTTLLIQFWHDFARDWQERAATPESALMVLQPGILRLVQRLALQPPWLTAGGGAASAAKRHSMVDAALKLPLNACLNLITNSCAFVIDSSCHPGVRALSQLSQAAITSSSSSHMEPSAAQMAMLMDAKAFWWGGVAVLASSGRRAAELAAAAAEIEAELAELAGEPVTAAAAPAGGEAVRTECSSATDGSSTTSTISSRIAIRSISSGSIAASLCPNYSRTAAWPACVSHPAAPGVHSAAAGSLEFLLLREVQGSLSWVLNQLQPFRAAQQAGPSSSGGAIFQWPLLVQWPLTPYQLSGSSSSSSRSRTLSLFCRCRRSTCHLCTPPPPVTLQQLRLVLEVVCLTCQDTTSEALQAPALLALLLQRASRGVKAAFLKSDGTRLMVALQQMVTLSTSCSDERVKDQDNFWKYYNFDGALSLPGVGTAHKPFWGAPGFIRAVSTLAWCCCEVVDPDTDTAASTPTPPTASPAAATAAAAAATTAAMGSASWHGPTMSQMLTPLAVAHGCILSVPRFCTLLRRHPLHTLQVPATSLRLAAGVRPSLALFATLEDLLRCDARDALPMLLATLLAAVRALLEPEAPDGCKCSQQAAPGSSASRASMSTGNTSSNSSSKGTGVDGKVMLPGVLEAVASVLVTVSKAISVAKPLDLPATIASLYTEREVVVLGAHLSNAVLQLALQQQHRGLSRGALALVQGAERLLVVSAAAAVLDMPWQTQCQVVSKEVHAATDQVRAAIMEQSRALDPNNRAHHLTETTRLLYALHLTACKRRQALTYAASIATQALEGEGGVGASAAATAPPPEAGAAAAGATAAEAAAAAAAAAAGKDSKRIPHLSQPTTPATGAGSQGAGAPAAEMGSWCPCHNSCMHPDTGALAAETPVEAVPGQLTMLAEHVFSSTFARLPLLGCAFSLCRNLEGPSAAGLVANRRGVLCSGCGVARYCSPACARAAWPAHRKVCGRLAAALGRDVSTTAAAISSGGSR